MFADGRLDVEQIGHDLLDLSVGKGGRAGVREPSAGGQRVGRELCWTVVQVEGDVTGASGASTAVPGVAVAVVQGVEVDAPVEVRAAAQQQGDCSGGGRKWIAAGRHE